MKWSETAEEVPIETSKMSTIYKAVAESDSHYSFFSFRSNVAVKSAFPLMLHVYADA